MRSELETEKTETTAERPLPRIAKILIVTEFVLAYVMASQFYILEEVAYQKLEMSRDTVNEYLDMKRAMGAFLSIVPAWLADSYTGKYCVFTTAYMLSCFWPVCLLILLYPSPASALRGYVFEIASYFSLVYYCVEPVRFVILSEQLQLPEQEDNLPLYIGLLFLARNLANAMSTSLLSIYGSKNNFIFGHTAILVILFIGYIFFFTFVKKSLKTEGPIRFIYTGGIVCLLTATARWLNSCGKKREKGKQFMDYAENKCDIFYIYNCKILLKISVNASFTIFVGMTEFLLVKITSSQMQQLVPLKFMPAHYSLTNVGHFVGILSFIIWNIIMLSLFRRYKVKLSPLHLYGIGYLLTGLALVSAFVVQFTISKTSTLLPSQGYGQMRIFNAHSSVVAVRSPLIYNSSTKWIYIPPRGVWTVRHETVKGMKEGLLTLKYNGDDHMGKVRTEKIYLSEEESVSYIISNTEFIKVEGFDPLVKGPPEMNDPSHPRIYVLCGLPFCFGELIFKNHRFIRSEYVPDANNHYSLFTLPTGSYNVTSNYGEFSNTILRNIRIEMGGVYSVLIYPRTHSVRGAAFFTVVQPNKISMAVILPQIILFNFGFLLCRLYGFLFIYTQAPPRLRCTVWSSGPYAFCVANFFLYLDRKYWHHQIEVFQITMYLVIHFVVLCLFIYYAFRYEYQGWCPEGAVFQGYPPLATRYPAHDRKRLSFLRKMKEVRSSREPGVTDRQQSFEPNQPAPFGPSNRNDQTL